MPAKKVVQDIVPNGKRSIRNIPVKRPKINERLVREIEEDEVVIEKPKKARPLNVDSRVDLRMVESATRPPRKPPAKRKSPWKVILYFALVIVCIGLIGTALSLLYTKGIVRVTPIVQNLNVDGTLTVKKDAPAEQLRYEVVTVSADAKKTVVATDGPAVQTKAKGTATLFNTTAAAQKLVAGTRLSNPAGLVFRTTTTVTIPAKGSISVGIIADQAGENYNMKLTDLAGDFKIVAYQGTSKYTTMYGRLKTDVTGGFSGTKKIISAEAQKTAELELQAELKSELLAQIYPIVPKGYVLFDNAYTIEYSTSTPSSATAGTADISMRGTINGIIFNSTKLLESVAAKELRTFPTQTYSIKGFEDLKFTISNSKDFSIKKATPLTFTLKGPVTLTGTFSEEKLKNDLKGISLKDSNAVFRTYSAISNAYATITPFWMRSFPNSIEHIRIEYKSQ